LISFARRVGAAVGCDNRVPSRRGQVRAVAYGASGFPLSGTTAILPACACSAAAAATA